MQKEKKVHAGFCQISKHLSLICIRGSSTHAASFDC
jgi:hypothetical protein